MILIIDDHWAIRENTCELLELEGYKVSSSTNGTEGLALIKEKMPYLVLCDINMPGMNGYEVLKALQNDPQISQIPIILMSSFVEETEMNMGLKLGAKGYLPKPFKNEELFELLKCWRKKTGKNLA